MLSRLVSLRLSHLKTAAIVLVGVVALFFFPAPRGAFVSTHGPMTSLAGQCESLATLLAIALTPWRRRLLPGLIQISDCLWFATSKLAHRLSPGFSILRI
jgi:hypothetical protein